MTNSRPLVGPASLGFGDTHDLQSSNWWFVKYFCLAGRTSQGIIILETFNLIFFVCREKDWSVLSVSSGVTGLECMCVVLCCWSEI